MEQGVNQFVTSPLAKHDCNPLGAGAHLLEIFFKTYKHNPELGRTMWQTSFLYIISTNNMA
jgi:hypothetical protein